MKVKVNRVRGGSMGDQRNYGLVTGSIWNYEDKPSTNNVSDTLGPVDRDQATIEAERGETVIYPDKDGQITHAKIGGKRHTHGGTPLDIPDGAFVYSDTRALLIKNKDVVKNIFGYNTNKAVTPAKLAARYDLNKYNEILNDPLADPLDKRTAQLMLENNMRKLGQLALVQEGMKGFPDGIPDIALPLFANDLAASGPASDIPQARLGGQIMRKGGRLKSLKRFQGPDQSQPGPIELPTVDVTGYRNLNETYGIPLLPTDNIPNDYRRATILKAINQYNEAIKSGDPAAMMNAAKEIEKIDVPGSISAGGGFMGLGERIADFADLVFGSNMSIGNPMDLPAGFNWQAKVNDMASELEQKADWVQSMSHLGSLKKTIGEAMKDQKEKYSTVIEDAKKVISNPDAYTAEQLDEATNLIAQDEGWLSRSWYNPARWGQFDEKRLSQTENFIPWLNIASASGFNFDPDNNTYSWSDNSSLNGSDIYSYYNNYLVPKSEQVTQQAQTDLLNQMAMTPDESAPADSAAAPVVNPAPVVKKKSTDTNSGNSGGSGNTGRSSGTGTQQKGKDLTDQEIIDFYKSQGIDIEAKDIDDVMRFNLRPRAKGGSIIMFDPVENKVLPRMQKTGQFNIYDKNYRDWLAQNKLKIITPSWWNQKYLSIGSQNPTLNPNDFTLSSEGLILPKTGIAGFSGIDNLIEYHEKNGIDFSKYDNAGDAAKGKQKFKEDLAKSAKGNWGDHEKATAWLLDQGEEENKKRAQKLGIDPKNMPSQINKGQTGWNRVGTDVITGFKYLDKEDTPPPPPEKEKKPCECPDPNNPGMMLSVKPLDNGECPPCPDKPGEIPKPNYKNEVRAYPWPDYAQLDLATREGLGIYNGNLPGFYSVYPNLYDFVPRDERAAIAQMQAPVAAMTAEFSGTPQGRANLVAMNANLSDPIAKMMSEVDNYNAAGATAVNKDNAGIMNEAQLRNIALRDRFLQGVETLRQNQVNAMNEKAVDVSDSYTRGAEAYRKEQGLRAKFPNQTFDMFGNTFFKPGYNPNLNTMNDETEWAKYYRSQGLTPFEAAKLAAARNQKSSPYGYDPMGLIWNSMEDQTDNTV